MVFKGFEIRKYQGNPEKYEVIKWSSAAKEWCYVVAFIDWNKKEPCWEFRSVGMRFIEDYKEGLCEFIQKFMELVDAIRKEEGEE